MNQIPRLPQQGKTDGLRSRLDCLVIPSPKRVARKGADLDGFYPYYAGFSENFANAILRTAQLEPGVLVYDPWNGSGTTVSAAMSLGLDSIGIDLNPVMVIVARARLLPLSETPSIEPLLREIVAKARRRREPISETDPLRKWFEPETAHLIRSIERSASRLLVPARHSSSSPDGAVDSVSRVAAFFYVGLFAVCRELSATFRSSNPTWLRVPRKDEQRVTVARRTIEKTFSDSIIRMVDRVSQSPSLACRNSAEAILQCGDATRANLQNKADFVLTSPPYCTRIDYTAATRIELAVLAGLVAIDEMELSRRMVGSTRVPTHFVDPEPRWGDTCLSFVSALRRHQSKASSGYYYRTHLDYYDKLFRSLGALSTGLRCGGAAVIVVQDSFYKDIHNDLPQVVTEMAVAHGLELRRRENFLSRTCMSRINPHARSYGRRSFSVEAVLCFDKTN